ncbi:serine aminopeptidase domain-containing protein [Pyxidicoccus xibeiensis]|uniref:serine aminopeptidase domain-containing protein n=1 Tax=Pyxidicoccus xibeiensis TaxID=2906759 RepID=UPI0020A78A65|nr:alpha/beta hydrolase [Pyxidicoccus xibeiensis]MCP3140862.1 alpha/beta hydrolase [Pyxidicoccus xibeiensis]
MQALTESPGYLTRGGDSLYYVHHRAAGGCRAAVVLAGPLGLERSHAYIVWTRWARHLAALGVDVLRLDYRGGGESTGRFADMTLQHWEEDVRAGLAHLRRECPGVPVVMHGLRLGALLAARVFHTDAADGLLLWDPPESGRAHLMELLRRKVAADNLEGTGGSARSRDDYVAELEAGGLMEVEGLSWSRALWRSTEAYELALPARDDARPWRVVHLDGRPAERCLAPGWSRSVRVPRPFFWTTSNKLLPDVGELFEDSASFVSRVGDTASAAGVRS